MTEATRHFKVGEFDCLLIKDGGGPRVATNFLQEAPPEELENLIRQHNLDPQALDFSINILHVQTAQHSILVDTGLGTSNLRDKLAAEGVDPNAIDTVIITHGHWDHIGGILTAEGDFVYPNARYIIWKTEWDRETATDRFAEGDTNPAQGVWKVLKAHPELMTIIGGDVAEAETLPGVCAIAAPGHTLGHIAVLFESNGEKLLHIADTAHHYVQMAFPQWSPNFDADKRLSVESRRKMFERVGRDGGLLMAYHFAFPGVGQVVEGKFVGV